MTKPWNPDMQVPAEFRRLIDAELWSGEHLTWLEQPLQGRAACKAIPLTVFGIIWIGVTISWNADWRSFPSRLAGTGPALDLFEVPFVLIGLALVCSPLWMWLKAWRTVYGVTDRRALIAVMGWRGGVSVRSFEPEALKDFRRAQRPDGSGDLVFDEDVTRDSEGHSQSTEVGFFGIRDVKSVEEKLRALVVQHRQQAAKLLSPDSHY